MITSKLYADPEVDAPPLASPQQSAPQQESESTGVAPRNDQFLEWYEAKGADTFHSHATIRDKWNALTLQERATICPDRPETIAKGTKGRQVVITGVNAQRFAAVAKRHRR